LVESERIEELLATQFKPERLLPLQIIYFVITAGVVVLFTVGFILGMRSAGQTVPSFAGRLAYISMAAPVLLFLLSNKVFVRKLHKIDGEGDVFGQVRAALLAKAGMVEGSALIGAVAW
jgi:predicted tellurium resistance membrane protein TerC